MDIQKAASITTATAVLGTGAFVVKGLTVPQQDYREQVPSK
jgi:hypothetical protein